MTRIKRLPLLILVGLLPVSGMATPVLNMEFVDADRYTDANLRHASRHDCDYVCKELQSHLTKLSAQYLASGQTLSMEIQNIDLAGRFEPWRFNAQNVRYLREVAWPRMEVRYELTANGNVLASGEESVSDRHYLMQINPYSDNNDLRFERYMLDEWFRVRFADTGAAR